MASARNGQQQSNLARFLRWNVWWYTVPLGFCNSPVVFHAYTRAYPRLLPLTPAYSHLLPHIPAYSRTLLFVLMHTYRRENDKSHTIVTRALLLLQYCYLGMSSCNFCHSLVKFHASAHAGLSGSVWEWARRLTEEWKKAQLLYETESPFTNIVTCRMRCESRLFQ